MIELILKSLYFFLPAYVANMAPILFKKVKLGDVPVSVKYFGKHKTWRGIMSAAIVGVIVFWIQKMLYINGFQEFAVIDYRHFSVVVGLLLGLGAILGDLVESYYKRKAQIPEGKPWIPFDQLDFVIGALVLVSFVYVPPANVALVLLIASPLLSMLFHFLGYKLGMVKGKI